MKKINEVHERKTVYPVKVLQFGEGNFLRAFVDYLIDIMNEKGVFNGGVTLCQPIERGLSDMINEQKGLYTVVLRGRENGEPVEKKRVIESVYNCLNPYKEFGELLALAESPDLKVVISNTTEAGIAFSDKDKFTDEPPASYPAKLTRVLYARFKKFGGSDESALLILPVELIDKNGDNLKLCVNKYADLWNLGEDFKNWLSKCHFANTLVDRIVTGFPKNDFDDMCEKLGYKDNLLDTAEPFFFWALEVPEKFRSVFPADKSGLNVVFADDISGYKMRKVRILNGAHTSSVLGAYLDGYDIVRDMMNDGDFLKFLEDTLDEEIKPYIPLPKDELNDFASSVFERFNNPFIDHKLLDISLNSVSKYKARCLPSALDAIKNGNFPKHLLFSLACLIEFYNGEYGEDGAFGNRNGDKYQIKDEKSVLDFLENAYKNDNYPEVILSNADFWGIDLTTLDGVSEYVCDMCKNIKELGVKGAMKKI